MLANRKHRPIFAISGGHIFFALWISVLVLAQNLATLLIFTLSPEAFEATFSAAGRLSLVSVISSQLPFIVVAAIGVGSELVAIPFFDGVRRVGEDHVELFELVAFDKFGLSQGVAAQHLELFDLVQEHVHTGNGGGQQVHFLAIEFDATPLLIAGC